eukprot:scaffold386838_cov40-Prasinocladus_malaysianus.AAC.1
MGGSKGSAPCSRGGLASALVTNAVLQANEFGTNGFASARREIFRCSSLGFEALGMVSVKQEEPQIVSVSPLVLGSSPLTNLLRCWSTLRSFRSKNWVLRQHGQSYDPFTSNCAEA